MLKLKFNSLSLLLSKCWSLLEPHTSMNKKKKKKRHGAAEVSQEFASHETCKC